MRVLIPLAGQGQRFKDFYKEPKPLIPVAGKPMIQRVIENFGIDNEFIFVVDKEMDDKYSIASYLKSLVPTCKIVYASKTGGATCTCLLASEYITAEPLTIANCDQVVDFDLNTLVKGWSETWVDGWILTFNSTHPKWSYARVHKERLTEKVIEVAEKKPISEHATVGIYYFKNGLDFVEGAKSMIKKEITTNGEFYLCPVYNELILMGKDIRIYEISEEKMHGMGTPEDVKIYETFLTK